MASYEGVRVCACVCVCVVVGALPRADWEKPS